MFIAWIGANADALSGGEGKLEVEKLKQLADVVGRERLVLDLSCRMKDGKKYFSDRIGSDRIGSRAIAC